MKTKDYNNKYIDREEIEKLDAPAYYLPDDYDIPCFHIYVPEGEYESDEVDVAFYLEIMIDNDDVIQKIIRYKDYLAFTNEECNRFPKIIENNAEQILKSITKSIKPKKKQAKEGIHKEKSEPEAPKKNVSAKAIGHRAVLETWLEEGYGKHYIPEIMMAIKALKSELTDYEWHQIIQALDRDYNAGSYYEWITLVEGCSKLLKEQVEVAYIKNFFIGSKERCEILMEKPSITNNPMGDSLIRDKALDVKCFLEKIYNNI